MLSHRQKRSLPCPGRTPGGGREALLLLPRGTPVAFPWHFHGTLLRDDVFASEKLIVPDDPDPDEHLLK